MNTIISDTDIVRGFLVELETHQSIAAHTAHRHWSHHMDDNAHEGIVQAQCYAFASQSLRLILDDDTLISQVDYKGILEGFAWYMGHMQDRALESRNLYHKQAQMFTYDTFDLMAHTYESIAEQTANTITCLELQKDANK